MPQAVLQTFKGQGVHLLLGLLPYMLQVFEPHWTMAEQCLAGPPEGVRALRARVVASLIAVGSKQMPTRSMWCCASSALYLACIASHTQPSILKHSVCIQRTKYTKRQREKGMCQEEESELSFPLCFRDWFALRADVRYWINIYCFFSPYSSYSGQTRPWKPANVVSGFLRYTDI